MSPRAGADDPPELVERFRDYRRSRSRAERNALVVEHRSLAEAVARRFADRGEPLADLEQVALVGLVKAVERYDPARGVPFAGYAVPTITGELRRHFRDATWTLKVGRRAKELQGGLAAAIDRLTAAQGRPPTPDELAADLDVSLDEVLEALDAAAAHRPLSLDTPGEPSTDPASVTGSGEGTEGVEGRLVITELLSHLSERDREIVALRFLGEMSQVDIAARVGLSQAQVSRVLRQAVRAMRRARRS